MPIDPGTFLKPLIVSLHAQACLKNQAPMAAYMHGQFPFLGIKTPEHRVILKDFLKRAPALTRSGFKSCVQHLYGLPEREFHYAAVELLESARLILGPGDMALVEWMIVNKSWWDTVDAICGATLATMLTTNPDLYAKTDVWSVSSNFWLRRAAIIGQRKLKEKTNVDRLFRYCRVNAGQTEFFIRKGIGWALREYAYVDAAAVRAFVKSTPLSALSVREALKNVGA